MRRVIVLVLLLIVFSGGASAEEESLYTIPLYFAPKENGVEFQNYEFHYILYKEDDLEMGPQLIGPNGIKLELTPLPTDFKLKFFWPAHLLPQGGLVEFKNPKTGQVFYSVQTPGRELLKEEVESWQKDIPFRYCMQKTVNDLKHSFCSKAFILLHEEGKYKIRDLREYRREQAQHERMANKKIVMAKDQAKLSFSFYPKGDESKVESVELPVTSEFMASKVGDKAELTRFTIAPGSSKPSKGIKIDQDNYDRNDVLKKMSKINSKSGFRFCANSACSPVYVLLETSRTFLADQIAPQAGYAPVRDLPQEVLINEKSANLKGIVVLKKEGKVAFKALLANGGDYLIELASPATDPDILDVIQSNDRKKTLVLGRGPAPLGPSTNLQDDMWQVEIDSKKPLALPWPDPAAIALSLPLKTRKNLPRESQRPTLRFDSRRGTYKNNVMLHGSIGEGQKVKVSSAENGASMTGDKTFDWDFMTTDKGAVNHRFLKVSSGQDTYMTNYEIYRGYPYEATLRFSSYFSDATKILLQGELGVSAWVEQFFKSENYRWSVQRWGSSLRYLTTIIDAQNKNTNSVKFSALNFDIKYNVEPGIWNHDVLYGPLLAYQYVNFTTTSGHMAGIGGYYGRPLSASFLGGLKWFRYPKWVEAQVDYYFLRANSATVMGIGKNFGIYARMKMFLKPNFFLEGGVGFRQFDFINQSLFILTQTGVVSGSFGAGLNF